MRLTWMLPLALAGCAGLEAGRGAPVAVPDDLRDAPAAAVPSTAGEALYLRIVSQKPEQAAETVMSLSLPDRELLGRHIVETKGREDLWSARFELAPELPAHESAFICWYLGGFTAYATVGRP